MEDARPDDIEWFTSKVDWWLAVILVLLPFVPVAVTAAALIDGNTEGIIAGVFSGVLVASILIGLVWPIRYGIGETQLTVRFGLVRQHIALHSIREVRPTHNLLSSPALSLDRLWIDHGGGILSLHHDLPASPRGVPHASCAPRRPSPRWRPALQAMNTVPVLCSFVRCSPFS